MSDDDAGQAFSTRRDAAYKAARLDGARRIGKGQGKVIESGLFRDVLGTYPTGVCVVTSAGPGSERWGMAVGTFTSISLDPPLVGFMPDKRSTSWREMVRTGAFCVNILGAGQQELCSRFATRGGDKFEGVSHGSSPGGLPLLDDVLAWIECDIAQEIALGDHLLVVGAVRALERRSDGPPLIFHRGGFHTIDRLGSPIP